MNRKLLFVIFLSLFSFSSFAQALKFKTFQTYIDTVGYKDDIPESQWHDAHFLVVINYDKDRINTYGQTSLQFDITKYYPAVTDDNGNKVVIFDAVDTYGDESTGYVTVFKDSKTNHVATLRMKYPSFSLIYRLQNLD